ncbi:metallophosphoesterase [Leptolyngbya sp. GB1-A1]|uniref:metallophosphoesterase family protein n=1 Tax=Leptolyngbya sp. GB1-A1 TaxID=2933908 RepID=UPI0032972151
MPFTRRNTLRLLGLAGISGISACIQQAATSQLPEPTPSAPPTASPTLGETAVRRLTQQGIFAPPRGDARIVVISDLNSQYGSTDYEPEVDRVIALAPDWQPDLVLCGGDMVAGQKASLTRSQIQAMWNAFDQHVSAPLRQANIPFGFTIGNHDASGARSNGNFLFAQERDLAAAYWNDPRHNPGLQFVDRARYPFYYSFQQNDIFFLVWDASTSQIPDDQLTWAERSLASSQSQAAKLRIAIGHLPLYAVAIGRDQPGEYLDGADRLRTMLERYGVHTYISGHNHAYFPGYVGKLQTLHSGLLGSGARQLLNGNSPMIKTVTVIDVNLNQPETTYTTYDAKTMQVVDQHRLPRLIDSPTAKILRRDVQWADLSGAERASQYAPRS